MGWAPVNPYPGGRGEGGERHALVGAPEGERLGARVHRLWTRTWCDFPLVVDGGVADRTFPFLVLAILSAMSPGRSWWGKMPAACSSRAHRLGRHRRHVTAIFARRNAKRHQHRAHVRVIEAGAESRCSVRKASMATYGLRTAGIVSTYSPCDKGSGSRLRRNPGDRNADRWPPRRLPPERGRRHAGSWRGRARGVQRSARMPRFWQEWRTGSDPRRGAADSVASTRSAAS